MESLEGELLYVCLCTCTCGNVCVATFRSKQCFCFFRGAECGACSEGGGAGAGSATEAARATESVRGGLQPGRSAVFIHRTAAPQRSVIRRDQDSHCADHKSKSSCCDV